MSKFQLRFIAAVLFIIFAVLAISSIAPDRKSATCDELAHHIPVGYVLWAKGDFKMDTSQPPLPRYIVAAPLKLFMKVHLPNDRSEWRRPDRASFGKDFFYKYNEQAKTMIFLSRLAVIIIGLLCAFILLEWTRMLYGDKVALLALLLYVFCPNILAHSALATTDMIATCAILLSVFSFWLFINKPSPKFTAFAGMCLGLAQLSKYTAILLYPMFLLLFLIEFPIMQGEGKRGISLRFFTIVLISLLVTWAGYGFDFEPILKNALRQEEKIALINNFATNLFPFLNEKAIGYIDSFLLNTPIPLGSHFLGILGVVRHGLLGHSTYLLGKWSKYGHPLYFVIAFLIKTPIPTLIFLISGIIISLKQRLKRNEKFIFISILVFFISASFSKLQLGLRYILPIYPFCFILAARSIALIKRNFFRPILIMLILWSIFSAIKIWPDYLSYFNEFIGGPKNGYKYLRDSNIDWGQDLPALATYMKCNKLDKIKFLYFGTAEPGDYGINYLEFNEKDLLLPQQALYAISVHRLEKVKWTARYKPDTMIGYSIFIYDLRNKEANSR